MFVEVWGYLWCFWWCYLEFCDVVFFVIFWYFVKCIWEGGFGSFCVWWSFVRYFIVEVFGYRVFNGFFIVCILFVRREWCWYVFLFGCFCIIFGFYFIFCFVCMREWCLFLWIGSGDVRYCRISFFYLMKYRVLLRCLDCFFELL